ncbi:MAG: glycoside hydrolase family 2 protein, partial [Muribaculaceae bacterium]|nr:glycoside hydrolase family 2 protein [Muribaculaceae bacterium]
MKSIYLSLFTPLLLTATECLAQVSFGNPSKFNDGWRFELSEPGTATPPESPDSTWRSVTLPHDWSIEGFASPDLASGTGYLPGGVGWYSRHFNYDAKDSAGRKKYIYFEGVYNRSEVYLNGHLLGTRPNGYASFMYDLTPYLQDGDNVLSVKVDHSRYADSRYYTGSGIYRDVWMIDAPVSHISQWGVGFETMDVKNGKADVKVNVAVDNPVKGMKVRTLLTDAEGKVVASATKNVPASSASTDADSNDVVTLRMNVPAAKLWDIDNPYLYTLRTELIDKGNTIDSSDTQVGIRTLAFTPDKGFFLNGRNRKVKGVCIHHDAGMLGAAVPEEVWERRLANLKALGVNALRMSHNPQAPVIYDIADRLGLLIMDEASDEWEFPKRKWVKGWNKGKPSFDGAYDFFEEWIDRDVADMVRRDRNHPSVFLWSIGNEVDYPNDPYSHPILDGDNSAISQPMYGGYNPEAPDAMRIGEIAKRLSKVVKEIDTSRPTTGALAGVVMSNQTAYPEAVDVVGYNYTEDRYDTDHATYPDRVIYGSENRSDYDAWKAVRDKDFIFGQFIWTGIDYLGESGEWPSRGLYTGLLDFTGTPKPRGIFRASLWSDTPMTYIGTYQAPRRPGGNRGGRSEWLSIDAWDSWNYTPGDTIRVVCYTTSPSARLLLSGNPVGEVKQKPDETGIIYWDIPYTPGKLVAEGLAEDGTVESSYTITTSGLPHSLTARLLPTPTSNALNPKPSTLNPILQIEIDVTDENGIPV